MSDVINMLKCGACGKVVDPHKAIPSLGAHFHAKCWNEIVDDLTQVSNECEDPWSEEDLHYFTAHFKTRACIQCGASTKEDCIGENLHAVTDISDL